MCIVPNYLFSPAVHVKNVFEERYRLLFRDALCSVRCIAGHGFDRSIDVNPSGSVGMTASRLSHASQNFPFGRTHKIFPPQNRDRYFHGVNAFPVSRVPRRSTLELTASISSFFRIIASGKIFAKSRSIYIFSNIVDRFFFNRMLFYYIYSMSRVPFTQFSCTKNRISILVRC